MQKILAFLGAVALTFGLGFTALATPGNAVVGDSSRSVLAEAKANPQAGLVKVINHRTGTSKTFVDSMKPSASHKGYPGGSVEYTRYGGGSLRYMVFDCDGAGYGTIYPGQWTRNEGNCSDTNGFYVESGSKYFCGERYGLKDYVYYPGWHDIGNLAYRACEKRAHNG